MQCCSCFRFPYFPGKKHLVEWMDGWSQRGNFLPKQSHEIIPFIQKCSGKCARPHFWYTLCYFWPRARLRWSCRKELPSETKSSNYIFHSKVLWELYATHFWYTWCYFWFLTVSCGWVVMCREKSLSIKSNKIVKVHPSQVHKFAVIDYLISIEIAYK